MKNTKIINKNWKWVFSSFVLLSVLFPLEVYPQVGGAFESKVSRLTDSIVTIILPAVSILGLIYAAILAAIGDSDARRRMALVLGASIVGFMAKFIIGWLKSASGVGGF